MNNPAEVAQSYFASWQAKDFETLRSLLADDVTFRGPMGTADGVEDCLKGLEGMANMIDDIRIEKIFVDGADVLTWYDLRAGDTTVPTVNWSHLESGKITRIRALFDPRPLVH
jgi:ketosteroid isomerase-like protein